jgi:4-hydroxy-tetrahydrodipicolinate reductase
MIKLLILGPSGFTSKLIASMALQDEEIEIVAACDVNKIGEKLGQVVGGNDKNKIEIDDAKNLENVIKETRPDVCVDFTIASATEVNSLICVRNGVRCVIGTTALSSSFLEIFKNELIKYKIPAVISSNMATGMNVFLKVAPLLTKFLSDWDIEVIEAHHNRKQDSPSGTALMIAKKISNTLGSDPDEILKYGRSKGFNKRKGGARNEIGIHSIRAGDIVGDHTVLFAGTGERIELKHQAHSRNCFAEGAIKAIKFIAKVSEPRIYDTNDVLGL